MAQTSAPSTGEAAPTAEESAARQALAAEIYDLYLKPELARQTVDGTLPALRDQYENLAAREGREIDETVYQNFADRIANEIGEDMDRLSGRMVALLSRQLSVEQMEVIVRIYSDPAAREVMAMLPPIFNRFTPAVIRERNVTLRRVMADYPPEVMLR